MTRSEIPILGLAVLAAVFGQTLRADSVRVNAIRFWTYEEATRIAVEISGEFTYRSERLHNPERIFFDIRNSRPVLAVKKPGITSVEDKLIKRIRIAETLPGVTRIVLDLTGPAEVTASQLANPDRLIIELRKGAARNRSRGAPHRGRTQLAHPCPGSESHPRGDRSGSRWPRPGNGRPQGFHRKGAGAGCRPTAGQAD